MKNQNMDSQSEQIDIAVENDAPKDDVEIKDQQIEPQSETNNIAVEGDSLIDSMMGAKKEDAEIGDQKNESPHATGEAAAAKVDELKEDDKIEEKIDEGPGQVNSAVKDDLQQVLTNSENTKDKENYAQSAEVDHQMDPDLKNYLTQINADKKYENVEAQKGDAQPVAKVGLSKAVDYFTSMLFSMHLDIRGRFQMETIQEVPENEDQMNESLHDTETADSAMVNVLNEDDTIEVQNTPERCGQVSFAVEDGLQQILIMHEKAEGQEDDAQSAVEDSSSQVYDVDDDEYENYCTITNYLKYFYVGTVALGFFVFYIYGRRPQA